jgi:hypothetical protein
MADAALIEGLENHLQGAVQRCLRRADAVAILAEPGVATAIVAALARDMADIPVLLVHARKAQTADERVRRLGRHLGLPLIECVGPARHSPSAPGMGPSGPAALPDTDPHARALLEAKLHVRRVLAPERGLEHSHAPRTEPAASNGDMEVRYPYRDPGLARWLGKALRTHAADSPHQLLEALARNRGLAPLI